MNSEFPHGSLVKIAAKAGVSKQLVTHILSGIRRANPDLAKRLVKAAKELNLETNDFDWLNPELTKNPLFSRK
jgi:transcriptional regulator with XRE-family HTH domain